MSEVDDAMKAVEDCTAGFDEAEVLSFEVTWLRKQEAALRARVAELEAGEIQFGVRWTGPRWQGGEVETDPNFTVEGIRSYIADYEPDEHGVAVQRRVGPWLPIDADAAPSVPSGEETP